MPKEKHGAVANVVLACRSKNFPRTISGGAETATPSAYQSPSQTAMRGPRVYAQHARQLLVCKQRRQRAKSSQANDVLRWVIRFRDYRRRGDEAVRYESSRGSEEIPRGEAGTIGGAAMSEFPWRMKQRPSPLNVPTPR